MQSDDRGTRAAQVLAGPIAAFRSALAVTADQVEGMIATHRASLSDNGDTRQAELGSFAAGRIDVDRFTALLTVDEALDTASIDRMQAVSDLLADLADRREDLVRFKAATGSCLRNVVADAVAAIGRAFGAARVVWLTRSQRFDPALHDKDAREYPYSRWSAPERDIAPPLIIEVAGSDLVADGLAEFLDGKQKIVLVVRGECPPAPLARLITPGTFVVQTTDPDDLKGFARYAGPGIAALVPDSAAIFTHDPQAGATPAERLTVSSTPSVETLRWIEGLSMAWQRESLRHLETLAAAPPVPVPVVDPAGAAAPTTAAAAQVDRLAAWLLKRTDLQGL